MVQTQSQVLSIIKYVASIQEKKEKHIPNYTILQKMKTDNSIRTFRKIFRENPITDFCYRIPHSLPIPVSPFSLDD